eukprot:CAMPEP_0172199498 /NCGR_PEP_ID=MMETSP1050-20130122/28729_1 /TAXON_ID=233186 /ORGANISM="Cryptomonas curvata, Strain CCAP979/52" /LENGTH=62 /DNA_ID=CAMNT_0012876543 /DNA_START=170 /DNA_END=355 /DNA_ORIENTATION=+
MTNAMAADEVSSAITAKYRTSLRIWPIPSIPSADPFCICSTDFHPFSFESPRRTAALSKSNW